MAGLARAIHAVEGKRAGLYRGDVDATIHAGHLLGVESFFSIDDRHQNNPFRQLYRLLNGCFQPPLNVVLDQKAVYENLDRVIPLFIELDGFIETVKNSVDPSADETASRQSLKLFLKLSFAAPDDGRENHYPLASGKLFRWRTI
jgi:hypothetical protein